MDPSEPRRLRQLEDENSKLKKMIAELSPDKQMLKDVIKKALKPVQKRALARNLSTAYRVSIRRSCQVLLLRCSVYYYKAHCLEDRPIRQRIREIAESRVRYGNERIHTLLRREGWKDNHKQTCRIYKEEGLNLRSKRPRRNKSAAHRLERPVLTALYQVLSLDFVSDKLFDGRKIRALTIVDNYSRECLAIPVEISLKGANVVAALNRLKKERGIVPKRIQADNGSEFPGQADLLIVRL